MTTTIRSRALPAAVTGLATALYYATPDVVPSRAARGWLKTGFTALTFAATVPDLRAALDAARDARDAPVDPDAPRVELEDVAALPTRSKLVLAGLGAAALTGTTALVVVTERWLFRRGEAAAAAGRRLPHTRTGLVVGAIGAALALLPPSDEPSGEPSAG